MKKVIMIVMITMLLIGCSLGTSNDGVTQGSTKENDHVEVVNSKVEEEKETDSIEKEVVPTFHERLNVYLLKEGKLENAEMLNVSSVADKSNRYLVTIGQDDELSYVLYIKVDGEDFEILDEVVPGGYGISGAFLVDFKGFTSKLLLCETTNFASMKGFKLFSLEYDGLKYVAHSESATGSGFDELIDQDSDGVFDGYVQNRSSYDVFYYPTSRYYTYDGYAFVANRTDVDTFDYPLEPKSVVKQYMVLNFIKQSEDASIVSIEERLSDIYPNSDDLVFTYGHTLTQNMNLEMDPYVILTTEQDEDRATVTTYVESYGEVEEYYLEREATKWTIKSHRNIELWDEYVSRQIKNMNMELLDASVMNSNWFEFMEPTIKLGLVTPFEYYSNSTYVADMDDNGLLDVLIHRDVEDSLATFTDVYQYANNQYELAETVSGHLLPVYYGGEYHLLSYNYDPDSKLLMSISEYKLYQGSIKKVKSFIVATRFYPYSGIDVVDDDMFEGLQDYELTSSTKTYYIDSKDGYDLLDIQMGNDKGTYHLGVKFIGSTSKERPSTYEIISMDDETQELIGDSGLTMTDDNEVIYGFDITKDLQGNVYFVKVTYNYDYYSRHNSKLKAHVYKLADEGVIKVESTVLHPSYWVKYDYESKLEDRIDHVLDMDINKKYDLDEKAKDDYRSILLGNQAFMYSYGNDITSKPVTIHHIQYSGYPLIQNRYAFVDMDGDGVLEIVVEGAIGDNGTAEFVTVFFYDGDKFTAEGYSHREMSDIKFDGTFRASGGAGNHGFYIMNSNKDIQALVLTSDGIDGNGNNEIRYYVGDDRVDESDFIMEWEIQEIKPSAIWKNFGIKDKAN